MATATKIPKTTKPSSFTVFLNFCFLISFCRCLLLRVFIEQDNGLCDCADTWQGQTGSRPLPEKLRGIVSS